MNKGSFLFVTVVVLSGFFACQGVNMPVDGSITVELTGFPAAAGHALVVFVKSGSMELAQGNTTVSGGEAVVVLIDLNTSQEWIGSGGG